MSDLDDNSLDIPRSRTAEQEALYEQRIQELAASPLPTPGLEVADQAYRTSVQKTNVFRSVGIFVTDIATKANESITALGKKFGESIPFTKAGAGTPTFKEMNSALGIEAATNSIVGAAYTSTGLLSGPQRQAMYNQTVPKATASAWNEATRPANNEGDKSHLVTLSDGVDTIEFLVMPMIVENRNVAYEAVQPPQFPGAFQKYKGTDSVQWTVNATLISRTSNEASQNLYDLNLLRSWTMPFFGEQSKRDYPTKLGAPPAVLKLKGLRKGIIGEVPVVITSLNWDWPKDVDYIPAQEIGTNGAANIPFPTVMQLAIQVVESFSTTEFNNFSLLDYKRGDMINAYRQGSSSIRASTGEENNHPVEQEAQAVGAYRGQRSDYDPARRVYSGLKSTAGGGRGVVNPPLVKPANDEAKTSPLVSGGGGSWAGAGANGRWSSDQAADGNGKWSSSQDAIRRTGKW